MKSKNLATAYRNLKLIMFESAITAGLLSMSIMTPFYRFIGLSQLEISWTQIIFTVIMIVLDLPMGWVADRFSRKWANVIGDFGCVLSFLLYAQADSFLTVCLCESLLGIFNSLSQGVDQGLLWHFCHQLDLEEDYFRRRNAQMYGMRSLGTLLLVWLGGPIGAKNFRLVIGLSGLPYLLGGVASLLIKDDSKKLVASRNPLQDIRRIAHESLQRRPLRLRIFVYAIGREMTHAIIWVYTPLLLLAGVPLSVVSSGWALNSITCLIGTKLAARYSLKLKDWQIFAVPIALMTLSMGVMSWRINLYTIWTYLIMGIIQGWAGATLTPLVQRYARPEEQTSVVSLAHTVGRLVYIPSMLLVGWTADRSLAQVPLTTLGTFVPIGLVLIYLLYRE